MDLTLHITPYAVRFGPLDDIRHVSRTRTRPEPTTLLPSRGYSTARRPGPAVPPWPRLCAARRETDRLLTAPAIDGRRVEGLTRGRLLLATPAIELLPIDSNSAQIARRRIAYPPRHGETTGATSAHQMTRGAVSAYRRLRRWAGMRVNIERQGDYPIVVGEPVGHLPRCRTPPTPHVEARRRRARQDEG